MTGLPTPPMVGEILLICGAGTVKYTFPLPFTPLSMTCTGPEPAVDGTLATIWVSDQLTTEAVTALNDIVLESCVAPKPEPFT